MTDTPELPKPAEWALQLAAQAWCEPTTSNIHMDEELATVFAQMLTKLADSYAAPQPLAAAGASQATAELPKLPKGDIGPTDELFGLSEQLALTYGRECYEAGRASRAQTEPREFQEYFEAHRAFVAAKNASDAATHANIVGYMNPENSGATDFDRVVAKNQFLGESADKARKASDSAMARFQAAKTAATLVSAPATLGETK